MLFMGCSSKTSYKSDIPVNELALLAEKQIGLECAMVEVPDNFVEFTHMMTPADYMERSVKINAQGVNIDEYGIFLAESPEQSQEIIDATEAYLQLRMDTWMVEYMPQEYPKLENAEYKVYGNYVVYLILDEEMKDDAFSTIEDALKAN